MRFTSETTSNGVLERLFTLDDIPGVLWSPADATDSRPLVLLSHGGGQHKQIPGLVARAHRYVTACGADDAHTTPAAPAGTPHGSPLAARRVRRSSSKRPHAAALNPFPRSSGGPHREAAAADPAALIGAGRLHQVAGDLTRLASTTNARDAGFLPIHRSRIALAASTGYTPKSHAHKTRVSARRPRRRPRLC